MNWSPDMVHLLNRIAHYCEQRDIEPLEAEAMFNAGILARAEGLLTPVTHDPEESPTQDEVMDVQGFMGFTRYYGPRSGYAEWLAQPWWRRFLAS